MEIRGFGTVSRLNAQMAVTERQKPAKDATTEQLYRSTS